MLLETMSHPAISSARRCIRQRMRRRQAQSGLPRSIRLLFLVDHSSRRPIIRLSTSVSLFPRRFGTNQLRTRYWSLRLSDRSANSPVKSIALYAPHFGHRMCLSNSASPAGCGESITSSGAQRFSGHITLASGSSARILPASIQRLLDFGSTRSSPQISGLTLA